jgi:hypothetical protein
MAAINEERVCAQNSCGTKGRPEEGNMSADKPDKLEPRPFVGTISEMVEMLAKSVESWDPVEKAVFRAGVKGKLSADVSERIQ